MGQDRARKTEIRKPKAEKSPNFEIRITNRGATIPFKGIEKLFRISFGFRTSKFGLITALQPKTDKP